MIEKLIQLPSKDWVRPSTITEIRVALATSNHPTRVIVVTEGGAISIPLNNPNDAAFVRDAIAEQINDELLKLDGKERKKKYKKDVLKNKQRDGRKKTSLPSQS